MMMESDKLPNTVLNSFVFKLEHFSREDTRVF